MAGSVQSFIDAVTDIKSSLAAGEALGDVRVENCNRYVRVKATATIAQYKNCIIDTADTGGFSVKPVAAATDCPVGVYEGSTSVTSGQYFWLTCRKGSVTVAVQGTVTAGDPLSASGTAGALQTAPFTAATKQHVVAIALEANPSGSANKLVSYISGFGGQ